MTTEIQIDGEQFLINGELTYKGRSHQGRKIEGLLFNSRMVQATFDDDNPTTADRWRYPDTGVWDPDRNTDEFCATLPEYRRHGLLGVTVGLQGGGSIYVPEVYDHYINSAFDPDGALKPAYCDRLLRVLKAADAAGLVVIVNYFYWKQVEKMYGEPAIVGPPGKPPSGSSRPATITSSSTSTTSSTMATRSPNPRASTS